MTWEQGLWVLESGSKWKILSRSGREWVFEEQHLISGWELRLVRKHSNWSSKKKSSTNRAVRHVHLLTQHRWFSELHGACRAQHGACSLAARVIARGVFERFLSVARGVFIFCTGRAIPFFWGRHFWLFYYFQKWGNELWDSELSELKEKLWEF